MFYLHTHLHSACKHLTYQRGIQSWYLSELITWGQLLARHFKPGINMHLDMRFE